MSTRGRSGTTSRRVVIKDLILFAAGLALIYKQGWAASKEDFNWMVLAFGVGLTQAPGAMAVISLIRGTGGGSSQPADSVPPAVSRSSSPSESAADDSLTGE